MTFPLTIADEDISHIEEHLGRRVVLIREGSSELLSSKRPYGSLGRKYVSMIRFLSKISASSEEILSRNFTLRPACSAFRWRIYPIRRLKG
jgi:hypothetical protein